MQRRKTRKGYWWWSWLLIFFAAGGTIGGWFLGEKRWEQAPKQYVSTAVLKVDITPPYVDPKVRGQMVAGLLNEEESQVLKNLKSVFVLTLIGENFDAWQRWGVEEADGVEFLRRAISFELAENKNLVITVTQPSAEDALELAKVVVERTIPSLGELAEQRRELGMKSLERDLSFYQQAANDAKTELVGAIKKLGVTIDPTPEMNLDVYVGGDREVLVAKIAWDRSLKEMDDARLGLLPLKRHWERPNRSAMLVQPPLLPSEISGPLKEPFQTQGAVAGVTIGLLLGLLAMLMCWKIFS